MKKNKEGVNLLVIVSFSVIFLCVLALIYGCAKKPLIKVDPIMPIVELPVIEEPYE